MCARTAGRPAARFKGVNCTKMDIVFKGPTFYCQEDEAAFFNWVQSLPEYVDLVGNVRDLHLSLKEPVSEESVIQLLTVFSRWGIESKALKKMKSKENQDHYLWK